MAYITQADVENVIPEAELIDLTDDGGALGAVNTTVLNAAIANAEGIINGYLRKQHETIPIASPGDLVKDIDLKFTKYNLYKRRRDTTADALDEGVRTDFEDAMKILKDIAKGMVLIDDSESFANTGQVYQSNKVSTDKVYTSTTLDTF